MLLVSLSEARDIAIIASSVAAVLAFAVILIVAIVSGFLVVGILRRVRRILKDNVQPASENIKATAQNIKGTVEYVSNTAVKPVVKAYGAAAGAKKFVGVVTRFAGRKGESN